MKKILVFSRLYGLACLWWAVSAWGMLQAQDVSVAQNVLTAETKMFLADWQLLRQKGLSAPEAEATLADLQRQYGLRAVTDGKTKSETWMLPVWLTFQSEAAAEPALEAAGALGFKVQTRLKTICTGMIPVDRIEALGAVPGLRQLQAGQRARLRMDLTRKAIRLDTLQDDRAIDLPEWPSLRGDGVVIGIVDGGIEYGHPNFLDPDDATVLRIKRVWSQVERNGTPPEGYDYGIELLSPAEILESGYSKDNETHGTHVAGIASGTGAGTVYRGVAPKADLVMVPTTLVPADILDGIRYIRAYAEAERKPCVINLSIGFQVGPHDGSSAFDRALDELKAPGFVVVGAAGNDGDLPLHIGYDFDPAAGDTVFHTRLNTMSTARNNTVDIWSDDSTSFAMGAFLIDVASGRVVARSDFYSARGDKAVSVSLNFDEYNRVTLRMAPETDAVNGKRRILAHIDIARMQVVRENYVMGLSFKSEGSAPSGLQMWSSYGDFSAFEHDSLVPAVAGGTDHTAGEIGGTGNSILTVGSFTTRNHWTDVAGRPSNYAYVLPEDTLSYFSSHGPTADGRIKPEITAPGAFLVSSLNSYYAYDKRSQVDEVSMNGRSYPFGAMMGTSMATPVVTGVAALCLQVRPDWQVDSLRHYLALTARNDGFTGEVRQQPNNDWGCGKIDAFSLMAAALLGITDASAEEVRAAVEGRGLLVYPNPSDGRFNVLLPDMGGKVRLQVVDRGGRVVYEQQAEAAGAPVGMTVPGLPAGLYVLRMMGDGAAAGAASAANTANAGPVIYSTKLIIK